MCGKSKQPYSLCDQLFGAQISSFYYSDINLFLIDYACCKLCNVWLLLVENNSRSYHYTGALHWRKNIVAVIAQDRVIDDRLKRQIKSRTLYTCRLFLLTRIFQYISNWSKVFEHLPTLFIQYTQSNDFSKFFQINNFSVDYAGLYINWANTSLFIIPGTFSTLKLPIKNHPSSRQLFFSDIVLVLNYHGCQGEATKLIPYYMIDIIYKTVKPSHLKKIANHRKCKKPNAPSHLLIF